MQELERLGTRMEESNNINYSEHSVNFDIFQSTQEIPGSPVHVIKIIAQFP